MKSKANFYIILAGILWGSMCIFINALSYFHFDSLQITFLRLFFATVCLGLFIFIKDKKLFKVKLKDLFLLASNGVFSILAMSIFYFRTIITSGASVAAILLYTSPIWVMIMSVIFLKEKFTVRKLIALICAFLGCVFVVGIGDSDISIIGAIIGIGAGIAYSLYSILGTFALKKYNALTVTFYAFLFACIGSLFFINLPDTIITIKSNILIIISLCILTSIVTAVLPFIFYTLGLKQTQASKAAIFACVEPMVATIIGVTIYGENLSIISIMGIVLVILAILILNNFGIPSKK